MSKSRREFLLTSAAIVGSAAAAAEQTPAVGTPPAFGTAPAVGPEVNAATFEAAEKLVQVELTPAERRSAADSWRNSMAALYERRVGPRKVALPATLAPF